MAEPSEPDVETREHLLDVLGELVSRAGARPLLLPPVVPGEAAFPDPWNATRAGIVLLLRRLAWHAGLDPAIEVEDRQLGARPTDRKPATRVPLVEVRRKTAVFALELEAGYLPASWFTYLVAVQAVLRGETEPPRGLGRCPGERAPHARRVSRCGARAR